MDLDFNKIFKISVIAMKLNGTHPEIKRNKAWLLKFIILHGYFTFVFSFYLYNIIYIDLMNNDFASACADSVFLVIYCVVSFKYGLMLRYQNILRGLIETMMIDYELAKKLPIDEQNIVTNYAMRGKFVIKLWILISGTCCMIFPIKALITMAYLAYKGEFELINAYDLTYPEPLESVKNTIPVYTTIFIVLLSFASYAGIMYIGCAPLGPILVLHACGQLELIKIRVDNLFVSHYSPELTRQNLKVIVERLQSIYRFVDDIGVSFQFFYEFITKATAVIVPISSYLVIESFKKGEVRLEFATFIYGGILISSIPCYYCDLLKEKGEDLNLAVYTCGWEKYWDRSARSTILLIMCRASRPIAIRTLFRDVSLITLSEVFHQSYAIFNLLNAATK